MKKIKIGDQEFEQAETIEDLSIKRWVAFKNEMIADEAGVDIPTLKKVFTQFTQEFDKSSMSGMYRAVYDYIYKLGQIEHGNDHSQMMYALITFLPDEVGEMRNSTDSSYLKEKLEQFGKLGLTQGQVVESVNVFIGGLLIA